MEIIKKETNIDFLGVWKAAVAVSAALILISIGSLVYHGGPKYGIDFEGGTVIQLKFKTAPAIGEVRGVISGLGLGDFSIQRFGEPEDLLIHAPMAGEGEAAHARKVEEALKEKYGAGFTVERVEMVGPKVGGDLREKAMLAMLYSLAGILIYITLRFELRYGVAAIVTLAHDTIITVGAFSILGKEFTLTVIAALLTIIGYSLNDTIVIFDRIRENIRLKRGMPLKDILNISINQTLSRTFLTAGTTLIVVAALFFLGGEVIHDFSFALLVGIVIGTYSSVYIAGPILLTWADYSGKRKTAPRSRAEGRKKARA